MNPNAQPYKYPSRSRLRRHAPRGYKRPGEYRPWLDDEFHFRCVYCLKRKVWAPTDIWCVEHLIPQSKDLNQACVYENLVLACQRCNEKKLSVSAPDPAAFPYGHCLRVHQVTGEVEPLNEMGEMLILTLKLNHIDQVSERRKNLAILRNLARTNMPLWKTMMAFPSELPNLRMKAPPGGNDRPEGVGESCYERRIRGELPEWYEE